MAASSVSKIYCSVIEDVISNIREAFLDDGVDEQIILELKQIWEKKLLESKAVDSREEQTVTRHAVFPVQQQSLQAAGQITQSPQQITFSPGSLQQASLYNSGDIIQVFDAIKSLIPAMNPKSMMIDFEKPMIRALHHVFILCCERVLSFYSDHLVQYSEAWLVWGVSARYVHIYCQKEDTDEELKGGQKALTLAMPQKVTIALPAQMSHVMSAAGSAATLALPPEIMTTSLFPQATMNQGSILNSAQALPSDHPTTIQYQALTTDMSKHQQHYALTINQSAVPGHTITNPTSGVIQLDGTNDTSDEDDDDEFHDNEVEREDEEEQNEEENDGIEEEPLNSNDDDTDEDSSELFYTDNVVVCQYDKITRSKNRWKFHLKDGIMSLKGKDYVFQKAIGDAEW